MKRKAVAICLALLFAMTWAYTQPVKAGVVSYSCTLSGWKTAPISLGDKTFTLLNYTGFKVTQHVSVYQFDLDNTPSTHGDDVFSLILDRLQSLASNATYTLDYQIT